MQPSPPARIAARAPAPVPEPLAMSADAAPPPARGARPVPRWLSKIMHERHGHPALPLERDEHTEPDPLACVCSSEHDAHCGSRDPCEAGEGVGEGCSGQQDSQECLREDAVAPACVSAAEEDLPLALAAHDLDPVSASPSSRYSYGDFSSASSTASSSTSHSGFSSASASSFTSASSTQTFSAAGWAGAASTAPVKACPALGLQSLAAAVEKATSEGATPVAEAPAGDVVALDFITPSAAFSRYADALPAPAALPPRPVSAAAAHDAPSRPSTACSLSEPASSVTLNGVPSSSLHRPTRPPSPSAASSATGADDARTTATADDLDEEKDETTLRPPENFAMVSPRLYRSSFPRTKNFPFLRSLGLKSVMVLVQEPYPEENLDFLKAEGIQFFQFGIPGNKEPFVSIPEDKIVEALSTILDARNHPMLIHCNKGKHRTGCVVGCLRRLQTWSLTSIFDEYRRYSHPKSRAMDLQCIEAFGGLPKVWDAVAREHLPTWATLDPPPLPPSPAPPPPPDSPLSLSDEDEL
ncbi:tyrosine-protein phosphatase siw14 [Rhodotorula kratochvilovae]